MSRPEAIDGVPQPERTDGAPRFPELGFYTLPGQVDDPQRVVTETREGERLGLGSVWISERLGSKDAAVLSGAAAVHSERLGLATGLIANLPLRNPLVVASYASTMATLSDGRFALGAGRGLDPLADASGTARLTFELMEAYLDVLRRLWRGETVEHDSGLGRLRGLKLGAELESPPPVIMGAMGERTCRWAGRVADGVLLNSLWSSEAVARSVGLIRQGAAEAGRDPDEVRVWAILITACEVPEEVMLRDIVRRMNTYLYFPAHLEAICRANGWDTERAFAIREAVIEIDAERRSTGSDGSGPWGDEHSSRELDDLRRMRELYPDEWIHAGNAVGSADHCARRVLERFEAGADGVLLHGSSPTRLGPLLEAWPAHRPAERFAGRSANPGL